MGERERGIERERETETERDREAETERESETDRQTVSKLMLYAQSTGTVISGRQTDRQIQRQTQGGKR